MVVHGGEIAIHHPGQLGAFGYRDVRAKSPQARRSALRRAAAQLGWLLLIRKLNALYVLNKHRSPGSAAVFAEDRDYASAQHRAEKRRRGI